MNIGQNCHISDKLFPKDRTIFVSDSVGNMLSIGSKVSITGCAAKYGFIGHDGAAACLFFAVGDSNREISVKWPLDKEVLSCITLIA